MCMQSKEILFEVRKKIPHGGISIICKTSNSSRIAVNKFFKGDLKNTQKSRAIQNAIISLLEETKREEEHFFNQVREI